MLDHVQAGRRLWVVALLVIVLTLGTSALVGAQESVPEVVITATEYNFEMPDEIAAGPTRLVLRNGGMELHHAQLFKLLDGVTMDTVISALENEDLGTIFMSTSLEGGPSLAGPGGNASVVVNLTPGTYLLTCFVESPEGVPHLALGMMKSFEVTGDVMGTVPAADATVGLVDFAFKLPEKITAGSHLWEVVNEGPQLHEMALVRLEEGATEEDLLGFFTSEEAPTGPPPFSPAGGVQALSVGTANTTTVTFEPGTYVAFCAIPDAASGQPHFLLGMVQSFTVDATVEPATMPATGGTQNPALTFLGWGAILLLLSLALRAVILRRGRAV